MSMNGETLQQKGMQLDPIEVLQEIERQFPKELQIAMQAVYIRRLEKEIAEHQTEELERGLND